jgi:cell cycle arrest protein BUB3
MSEGLTIFFLIRWDLQSEECRVLSSHSRPISSLLYLTELSASLSVTIRKETDFNRHSPDLIATGSWDSTVALHDPRASKPQVASFTQPERVYHMDAVGNTLVVAMGGRKINIFDVRRMDKPTQERDSSLRFMTRALACMPTGEGRHHRSVLTNATLTRSPRILRSFYRR